MGHKAPTDHTHSLDHLFQLSVKAQIFQCLAGSPLHLNMADLLRSPEGSFAQFANVLCDLAKVRIMVRGLD